MSDSVGSASSKEEPDSQKMRFINSATATEKMS